MDIPIVGSIAYVTLTARACLIRMLLTNTTTAPFLSHALWTMRCWMQRCKNGVAMLTACLLLCQILSKLQLKTHVYHWFLQETETHITVNYPHVCYSSIKHVKKQMVPPLVASGNAGIDTPHEICCIHASHVLCVLEMHWSCFDLFFPPPKLPPHKWPFPQRWYGLYMCG
jgi:hypothetical protein